MLELYDYPRSSAAFRVRLALNYKGLDYSKIKIDLLNGEQKKDPYLALNAAGLVPSLVTEDGQVLSQSLAILDYLEQHYREPPLLPHNELEQAYVRAFSLAVACDTHPLNNLRVLNYLRKELGQSEESVNAWYQHWIKLGLSSLEEMIAQHKFYSGSFVCGGQFSMADACLLPQIYNARRFACDLSSYPRLLAIEAHCRELSWVVAAYPEAS